MMFRFAERRELIEKDGVYIGGYGIKKAFVAAKQDGRYDTSEDRIERLNAVEEDWSPAEEAALLRKLDLRVLLPCCLVYFVAYLDRVNLGNVKVLRTNTPDSISNALDLQGTQFNWAVSISYFSVTALLLPSTIILKRYSAKRYFPCAMVLWGMIVMAMVALKNGPGLLAARFCLGIPESGVVPCCVMYFSFWYRPRERAWRIAVFHLSNSIAGAVSGFLAAALDKVAQWQRWTCFMAMSIAIVLALPIYFALLTFAENSTALSERVAVSQATFLPSIFHYFLEFGTTKSNLYTAALYLGIIPFYLMIPLHSDWKRLPPIWTHFSFHSTTTSIRPISLYGIAIMGKMISVAQPIVLSYRSSTLYGAAEQAVGTSAAVASLSIGSIIGPQMFPDKDKPLYHNGFMACMALEVVCILVYLCLPVLLLWEAQQRKRKTGHAMPLRAILDAENAQEEAAMQMKQAKRTREGRSEHVENV
ncbi:major facilitator superfamily domain-containing protein [Aspergillus floccosus]